MYIDSDRREIYYIGSAARDGRSFRARFKEELHLPTTTLCSELRNLGVNIETLSLKVAPIKSVIDNSRKVNEVDVVKIEMSLICATEPLYDPHGPMHAKKNFIIENIGNRDPLPEFLRMRKRQKCRKHVL